MTRDPQFFVTDYWYHIFNRGVEKRIIFLDNKDHERFIFHLFECNNEERVLDTPFSKRKKKIEIEIGSPTSAKHKRKLLVDIICFVLMPNHFHILLRQRQDKGISLFMQKVCTVYAKYFNKKYSRIGSLFQGNFQDRLVEKNEYFNYLFYYILTNPIEIIEKEWKEKGIKNYFKVKKFLQTYKWSSLQDFFNKPFIPFLVDQNAIFEIFGQPKEFEIFIDALLENKTNKILFNKFNEKLFCELSIE